MELYGIEFITSEEMTIRQFQEAEKIQGKNTADYILAQIQKYDSLKQDNMVKILERQLSKAIENDTNNKKTNFDVSIDMILLLIKSGQDKEDVKQKLLKMNEKDFEHIMNYVLGILSPEENESKKK